MFIDVATSPQPFGYNRQQVPAVPASPVAAVMAGRQLPQQQLQQQHQLQHMRGQATKRRYSSREGICSFHDIDKNFHRRVCEFGT